jgi:solute carrier family 50 protein (sugar transporter)
MYICIPETLLYVAIAFNVLYFFLRAKLVHGYIQQGLPSDTYSSCFSYLVTLINCILWVKFSIESTDVITATVNACGLILSGYSLMGYYYMAEEKTKVQRQILIFMSMTYGYLIGLKIGWIPWWTLGPLSCMVMILMLTLPLISYMVTLSRVRSGTVSESTSFQQFKHLTVKKHMIASFLSPVISIVALISSTAWTLYGKVTMDDFIYYPNMLGAIVSLLQVAVTIWRLRYRSAYGDHVQTRALARDF